MGAGTLAATDARADLTSPAGAVRGTVLVLPGRGDAPSYYRRLAERLAVDGYATRVATTPVANVDDIATLWDSADAGVRVVIGVDVSAGLLATALAASRLDPPPAGAVFAGTAVEGGEKPAEGAELAARSACPVHRTVVDAAGAAPLAASDAVPVWPAGTSTVPVLAVHGGADAIAPRDAVASLLRGWDAELVTVEGGLHDVLNDVHHRSVAAEIVAFLERLRVDPAGAPILRRENVR